MAASPENYASLLGKTGHCGEATMMEAGAKAIRAKHAEQNPGKSRRASFTPVDMDRTPGLPRPIPHRGLAVRAL